MTWWLVNTHPEDNGRTFGAVSLNVVLVTTVLMSIAIVYIVFAFLPHNKLIFSAEQLASLAWAPSNPALSLISETDGDRLTASRIYFIYLASLAIFVLNIWFLLARLHATQCAIAKRMNSKSSLSQSKILAGVVIFGSLTFLFNWIIYYFVIADTPWKASWPRSDVAYAACWVLIAMTGIAFWTFVRRYNQACRVY